MELRDKLYTSTQVAEILGVSLRTLYRYMEDGKIESMKTASGRHRFTKEQIMNFLNADPVRSQMIGNQGTAPSVSQTQVGSNQFNNGVNTAQQFDNSTVPQTNISANPNLEPFSDQNVNVNTRQDNVVSQKDVVMETDVTRNYQPVGGSVNAQDKVNSQDFQNDMYNQAQYGNTQDMIGHKPSSSVVDDSLTSNKNQETDGGQQVYAKNDSSDDLLSSWVSDVSDVNMQASNNNDVAQGTVTNADQVTGTTLNNKDMFSKSNLDNYDLLGNDSSQSTVQPGQNSNNDGYIDSSVNTPQVESDKYVERGNSSVQGSTWEHQVTTATSQAAVNQSANISPVMSRSPRAVNKEFESKETMPQKPSRIRFYKSEYTDLIELAKKIKEVAQIRDLEYAFTLDAGLSLHFGIRPFTILNFYANPEDMNIWVNELRLMPVKSSKEANIGMLINNDIIFVPSKVIGGFRVVEDKILLNELAEFGEKDLLAQFRQFLTSKN